MRSVSSVTRFAEQLHGIFLIKRIKMEGFIVSDHRASGPAIGKLAGHVNAGRLKWQGCSNR